MWEHYGEDSYLNAEMGVQAVRGFQGGDPNHVGRYNVAACVKHYMGYGVPVSGKDRTPSAIPRSDLREKHFAPYLAAVRAGALSVMVNSAVDNGMPFHANRELLTKWLTHRDRLGRHKQPLHARPHRGDKERGHKNSHQRRHRHVNGAIRGELLHLP